MSRLHDILTARAIMNNGDRDIVEGQIKILMLDIFIKAMKADNYTEMGNIFRKEVREL